MDWNKERNLTMLVDFYELTMANGYLQMGMQNKRGVFDMFFRKNPDNAGFSIMAGVEQMIEYLTNLKFTDEDIEFLRKKGTVMPFFAVYPRKKFTKNIFESSKLNSKNTLIYAKKFAKGNVANSFITSFLFVRHPLKGRHF